MTSKRKPQAPHAIMSLSRVNATNLSDPTSRAAYIEARRHPDLHSVAPDLAVHYRKFWNENGSAREPN